VLVAHVSRVTGEVNSHGRFRRLLGPVTALAGHFSRRDVESRQVFFGARVFMRNFIGIGLFLALALVVRFGVFSNTGVDIFIHDTYYVIPLRMVAFWLDSNSSRVLSIAAAKFARHDS
jgi:hypothetical protein